MDSVAKHAFSHVPGLVGNTFAQVYLLVARKVLSFWALGIFSGWSTRLLTGNGSFLRHVRLCSGHPYQHLSLVPGLDGWWMGRWWHVRVSRHPSARLKASEDKE